MVSGVFLVHSNTYRGRLIRWSFVSQMSLERATKEGNSPVGENDFTLLAILLEYGEKR